MAFPWGAIIGGAASLLGGRQRNKAAQAQSAAQMAFQERMSSTAHQREVTDLRAAGLNPILSATGGSGASSPAGAQAPITDVITPAVNTALAAKRNRAEVDLLNTQDRESYNRGTKAFEDAFYARQLGNSAHTAAELARMRLALYKEYPSLLLMTQGGAQAGGLAVGASAVALKTIQGLLKRKPAKVIPRKPSPQYPIRFNRATGEIK